MDANEQVKLIDKMLVIARSRDVEAEVVWSAMRCYHASKGEGDLEHCLEAALADWDL